MDKRFKFTKEELSKLLLTFPRNVFLIDMDGKIIIANKTFMELSPTQLESLSVFELFSLSDFDEFRTKLQNSIDKNQILSCNVARIDGQNYRCQIQPISIENTCYLVIKFSSHRQKINHLFDWNWNTHNNKIVFSNRFMNQHSLPYSQKQLSLYKLWKLIDKKAKKTLRKLLKEPIKQKKLIDFTSELTNHKEVNKIRVKEEILPDNSASGIITNLAQQKKHKDNNFIIPENTGFFSMFKNSSLNLWIWNIKKSQLFTNNSWKTQYGCTKNQHTFNIEKIIKYVHNEDKEYVLKELVSYLKGISEKFEVEYRFKVNNQKYVWVKTKAKITEKDKNNNPKILTGINFDITESKKVINQIKKSERIYKKLFDEIPIPIIIIDKDSIIKESNKALEIFLDTKKRNLINKNIETFRKPNEDKISNQFRINNFLTAKKNNKIGLEITRKIPDSFGNSNSIILIIEPSSITQIIPQSLLNTYDENSTAELNQALKIRLKSIINLFNLDIRISDREIKRIINNSLRIIDKIESKIENK